jgi:competence protein ComEC
MMKYFNRIRVLSAFLVLTTLFSCLFYGCKQQDQTIYNIQGFSVHYIDVGQGDCTLIRLGDGKCMLIDTGAKDDYNFSNITKILESYKISTINYLVLTHPDIDHVGNAQRICQEYKIEKAFIPNILDKESYTSFNLAYAELVKQNTSIEYSSIYSSIKATNYYFAFLSPCSTSGAIDGNYYTDFNLTKNPSDIQVNDLSPIIYLEYLGLRFLFTGDASKNQEGSVIDNYNSKIYENVHGKNINLYDVDFLKVAHHGSSDSCSSKFLDIVSPKNAVISVGGGNNYGHPAPTTINALTNVNNSVEILRTDILGTIAISVNRHGKYSMLNSK